MVSLFLIILLEKQYCTGSIIHNYFSGETVMEWMAENRILSVVLEGNIDQVDNNYLQILYREVKGILL